MDAFSSTYIMQTIIVKTSISAAAKAITGITMATANRGVDNDADL